ncbi:MAG: LacI family DNA-binding transcriptional regulator [Chitinophagaceae bacterium]|nr:LacI family DNA-binding transcriptional regulator [Chitinophagaceae bacterium]
MKSHVITIKDIARGLNISVATVSRALRNAHDVSQETRKAVLDKAHELKYKPNFNAVGLVKNRSNNIGVVLPVITTYYFSAVITGIQEVAFKHGFNVVLYITDDSAEREREIFEELSISNVGGLLVCASSMSDQVSHFQDMMDSGVQIVFFDRVPSKIKASQVTQDDFNGAYHAVKYLVQCGYKKIAHITGAAGMLFTEKRLKGYTAALTDHRLSIRKEWIIHSGLSQKYGEADMLELLKCTPRPDAVFAVSDRKAVGAIIALKQHKIKVGRDIGVIGFTNDPLAEIIQPSLTTMEEPAVEMGRISCELLVKHLSKKHFLPREIILPTRLIVRDSTRKI